MMQAPGRVSRLLALNARAAMSLVPLVLIASLVYGSKRPVLGQKNNDPCSAVQETLARAKRSLEDDQEEQAFVEYNEAISKSVACGEPYMGRGVIFLRRGESARAIADFDKAIELDPKNKTTYMFRGLFFQKTKEDLKAVADFTKNIELCTKKSDCSSAVYSSRADSYMSLKEFDKAINDYTKAISIDPNDAESYHNRGLAYLRHKAQLDLALADVEKAISLEGTKGYYYRLRGSIMFLRRINEEDPSLVAAGLRDLTRAIELEPNDYKNYEVRATMYRMTGKTEKADADLKMAEELKGKRFLQKSP